MRVVIGENSALFGESLAQVLADAGHDVVAVVPDARALVETVRHTRPDLAIVDTRMPPNHRDDGARAARQLRWDLPDLGIVLLSQQIEAHHSVQLVTTGHVGYLLKDRVRDVEEFLDALNRVAAGGSALDPQVVSRLIGPGPRGDPLGALDQSEREVFALMAEGRTSVDIARKLWLTRRTVESHVGRILDKLRISHPDEDHQRAPAVVAYLGRRGNR
jgi:DNA-binding NarL/FixJ family response regulator